MRNRKFRDPEALPVPQCGRLSWQLTTHLSGFRHAGLNRARYLQQHALFAGSANVWHPVRCVTEKIRLGDRWIETVGSEWAAADQNIDLIGLTPELHRLLTGN